MKSDLASNRTVFLAAMLVPPVHPTPSGGISTTTWGKSTDESFETHEMLKLSITGSAVHLFTPSTRQGKVVPRATISQVEISDPDASLGLFTQGEFQATFRVNWCKVHTLLLVAGTNLILSLILAIFISNGWIFSSWRKFVGHAWPLLVAFTVIPPLYFAARAYWIEPRNCYTRVQGQPGYHHVGRYCGGALLCGNACGGSAALHR